MSWGRGKEVRVTSRAELDAALRSADRIVIEGDPALAAYAAGLASTAPNAPSPSPPSGMELRPVASAEREGHIAAPARAPRLWPWVAGVLALALAALAAVWLEHFAKLPAPQRSVMPGWTALHAPPAAPAQMAGQTAGGAANLAWPAVAIVLIAAIYMIARQAIAAGRDVQIAWQVTEKVSGRLVIAKVRTRAA